MDYNKLKTFITVAELGSITAAGEALRRSQSAISQQIQLFEEELQMQLLERKNARIFLSLDGEKIFNHAKQRLNEIDDNISHLKGAKENVEGHIQLGELGDFGNKFQVGRYLGNFSKKYPLVTFSIKQSTSPILEQDLLNNKIDLAFTVYYSMPEMFHQIPIEKTWHSLYTSKQYLKKVGSIKNYKKILSCDLIDLDENFICIGTFLRKNAKNIAPRLKYQKPNTIVSNHLIAKQIVSAGHGIAILPDYFVEDEVKREKFIQLMPSAKSIFSGLDLAYRTNKTLRLCEKLFIKYIQENCLK